MAIAAVSFSNFVEPKATPLERYHEVVKRALWDPLGINFLNLAGRYVVILTVFPGYLIASLLSIPYWNEEKRVMDLLHTHKTDVSLPREPIRELCHQMDVEYLYEGPLDTEKRVMDRKMQDPKFQRLIRYIRETKNAYAVSALMVILGIKPAVVFEVLSHAPAELFSILEEIAGGSLVLRKDLGGTYFVNEHPLSQFDPRKYLKLPNRPLIDIAIENFPNQNQLLTDQILSYVLGFGPSWESYSVNCRYIQNRQVVKCCFSEHHFTQIGRIIYQKLFHKRATYHQAVMLGHAYHCQYVNIIKYREYIYRGHTRSADRLLNRTGTGGIYDGLALQTDYFKQSYTLKKWVMETFFP